MKSIHAIILAWAGSLAFAAAAQAVVTYNDTVSPTKSGGDFIPGDGIPAGGFTIDTHASGVSVALKARGRDTGNPLSQAANVYVVSNGLASNNISPWWNFDLQFSPGDNGSLSDLFQLFLTVDFDPTPAYQYITFGGTIPFPVVAGFVTPNPGGGAWSSNDVDFVVADSSNLGFAFWSTWFGTSYDPDATGEYTFSLVAKNQSGTTLAQSDIIVQVVPEPAAMGLFSAGVFMIVRRKAH